MDNKKPPIEPRIITTTVEGMNKEGGVQEMIRHMTSIGPQLAAQFNENNNRTGYVSPAINNPVNQYQPNVNNPQPESPPMNNTNNGGNWGGPMRMQFQKGTLGHDENMQPSQLPKGHDGMSSSSFLYRHDTGQHITEDQARNIRPQENQNYGPGQFPSNNPYLGSNNTNNHRGGYEVPLEPVSSYQNQYRGNTAAYPGALNLVPNYAATTESTLADSDPRYIELPPPPSRCFFYDWKRLSIRRLQVPEVRKAYQAQQTGSFRHFAQLLASTLDRPYLQLTIFDFWWCMYYHQQNSYPKAPGVASYKCSSKHHLEMVRTNKWEEESLNQKVTVYRQELQEIIIPDENNMKAGELMKRTQDELGIILYPPTVQDTIELEEDRERLEDKTTLEQLSKLSKDNPGDLYIAAELQNKKNEYQDLIWINNMASWLHPYHGQSIEQRRGFLERPETDIEIFNRIEEFQQIVQHGVSERVTAKCPRCAGENVIPVTLSPAHFLPELQRAKFAGDADAGRGISISVD